MVGIGNVDDATTTGHEVHRLPVGQSAHVPHARSTSAAPSDVDVDIVDIVDIVVSGLDDPPAIYESHLVDAQSGHSRYRRVQ